jgi:hypothetical protein
LVFALVTAHGGGKGDGGTNTLVAVSGGETNAVDASTGATNSLESATVDAQAIAAMVEDLQDAEITRLGLDPDGAEAVALLSGGAIVPAWYLYSRTDTDQDGIPDLWETWTRSNPLDKYDGVLDLDDDGLNALYEFWNQTDPRTADTDGDGFDDGFESSFDPPVTNINPIVKADFTPVEPDADTNGVIDLWEGSGLLYGFQDANADGFDDTYAATLLPAASDANFDVLVDARTSRSAALTWEGTNGSGGIVLLATAGTTVRLRLPFGADTELKLSPAPDGASVPADGELWKSRLRLVFAPRAGQTLAGSCVVASDGAIAQRSVVREAAFLRFPDGDGAWPGILVLERRFGIVPSEEYYHSGGDVVGPFVVTNTVNVNPQAARWSASDGTMFPTNGPSSALTVTVPEGNGPILVTASVRFDADFATNRTATVWHCPRHDFSLDSCTANFAPLPGSSAVFSVTLPGCRHGNEPGWLEAEMVRITTEGTQHVAWVDMDDSTPAVDRYGAATNLPHEASFAWDGIAQNSLDQAEYAEVFTQGKNPFNLAAPAVSAGQPVPPPRVTLVVRLRNEGKTEVLAEVSREIHVPQIVQVRWETAAGSLFRTPKDHVRNGVTNLVYSADYTGDSAALMEDTLQGLRAYYPASVNILFVPFYSANAETTKFLFITPDLRKSVDEKGRAIYQYGVAPPNDSVQRSAMGMAECFLGSIYDSTFELYKDSAERGTASPFPAPVSSARMLEAVCRVSAHEVGHTLGLVDTHYLDGVGRSHNPGANDQTKMMNISTDLKWLFNPHPAVVWRSLSGLYLEFVLPVPE